MITYSNIFYDILETVRLLIRSEFDESVSLDRFEDDNGSFFITPVSDEFLEDMAISHVRNYQMSIKYKSRGTFEHLTKRAERLKRLLFNNSNYGSYKWHDGTVVSVEYTDGEFELIYQVTVHEAIG